jgi:hypothetical protein
MNPDGVIPELDLEEEDYMSSKPKSLNTSYGSDQSSEGHNKSVKFNLKSKEKLRKNVKKEDAESVGLYSVKRK